MTSRKGWTLDTLAEYLTTRIDTERDHQATLYSEREVASKERRYAAKEALALALATARETTTAAMLASEKSANKAEYAAEKRAEASNEIRAAMIDQQKTFAEKTTTELRFGSIEQRLDDRLTGLSKRLDTIDIALERSVGKAQGVGMTTAAIVQIISSIGAIGAIIGAVVVYLKG